MREEILTEVKTIIAEQLNKYQVKVYLYGSWARGEEKQSSDIDIAISAIEDLPVGLLSEVRDSLENSTLPYRVELVNLNSADTAFSNKVKEEGIEWIV